MKFKDFYVVVNEDATQQLATLQAQIASIDQQMAQMTKTLAARKASLEQQIANLQKQQNLATAATQPQHTKSVMPTSHLSH